MRRMRIGVGGIEHESSSFIPQPTPLSGFIMRSGEAIANLGSANDIIDGIVKGVRESGMEPVPLFWAFSNSGGLVTPETYGELKEKLLAALRKTLPLDGVILSLHGSFSAQGVDDADGDILGAVRKLVGPDLPIISVHDLHCNISRQMAQSANALIVERTYPHVDMTDRGVDGAQLMFRTLKGEVRPTMAFRSLPMFWAAPHMITEQPPMDQAIRRLASVLETPGVLTASLGVGYQWADSPIAGASTIVVTDNNPQLAQELADSFARWVWDKRKVWQRESIAPGAALDAGERERRYPIILADQADNPGGGAPGDSTEILRLFVDRKLQDAAVLYVVDPPTALAAKTAGVGAIIHAEIGGKSHPLLGPPVPLDVEVLAVSDGCFVYDGPMWAGREEFHGNSALLRHRGISIVVISEMCQPMDLAFPRLLGLDCTKMRYICVKSTGHFRSGFGPIAGSIYNVDAAGLLTQDFKRLPFQRLGRKVYPMDPDAAVDWSKPCD